jgi:hypothetical protein
MNAHLVFNHFTVRSVLWQELPDQFVEGFQVVGAVRVVEFSEQVLLHELVVVFFEM